MKALALIALAFFLALAPSRANAHLYPPVIPPPVIVNHGPPPGAKVHVRHHGGQKFICWANPAGFLVCTVVVLIVVDKVKRVIDGPACATMKWRQSWFGKVRDMPELWLPLCSWQKKGVAVATVAPQKLWKDGK